MDVGRIPSESGSPAPTPLPYDRILVLVMVLLGDTICMSVILPFVPFMVEGFLRGPEHDIGYYSGLLGAAYQLGQLCFPFWGAISDNIGRRPVMLGCLSASCVYGSAAGTFGFALGPLWGGSLYAASSAPGALGVFGKGRLFFLVLSTLAAVNSQLARPRVPSSALRRRREASTHRPSRCRRGPRTRVPGATCFAAGRVRCRTSARAGHYCTDCL